jgi:arabinose-5-phosphate isomerase
VSVETARRVLAIEARGIEEMARRLDERFDAAVRVCLGCRGRIVLTGMGKSGIVAQKIAATFSSIGMPAYFMHPAEAIHGDLGMIVGGDVVLAVSNSGETDELVRLLEIIRRLGATIIAMSGRADSTLARHADVFLDVAVREEACSLDLVPTASTTAALAMGDALAVACSEHRGLTPDQFATYHPGGRIGRKLLKVGSLMHRGDDVPAVPVTASMAEAVREMSAKRLGMTCVVGDGGKLVGILTDGDLRRLLLRAERPLDGSVSEAMTRDPRTIGASALASEALRMMETRKITSLPVVDANGVLDGVIQIHDLWRTELF